MLQIEKPLIDLAVFNHPRHKYFIAVYTNEVKDYCDDQFFNRVYSLSKGNPVHVVDNSNTDAYYQSLRNRFSKYPNFHFHYVTVDKEPRTTLFHRRITASAQVLRDAFLQSNYPYFVILESDVIAPRSLLYRFEKTVARLEKKDRLWGMLGGLYHQKFHRYHLRGLQRTHHVLSGCTLYRRELIEKFPFRWSTDNMKAFPDAWICWDAKQEFHLYDDHGISCLHIENRKTGNRYSKPWNE